MTEKSIQHIDFSYIRYANCWEDANVVISGLNPDQESRILSIGSAGDNSFSLLTTKCQNVTAIDINPVQIYLIELKKAAIALLDYNEVLGFLGFKECSNRQQIFQKLKKTLPQEAFSYWTDRFDQIELGIIHQGKFEKYFQFFSRNVLPWIHNKEMAHKLMKVKSISNQEKFYQKKWNNLRWRMLFHIFFSRAVMGKYGRDKRFFKEVNEPVAKSIFKRVEQHLTSDVVFNNEFLEYILFRKFDKNLPHYLQPENFALLKENIHKLDIIQGSFGSYFTEHCNYTHLNLSDIFEYLSDEDYKRTANLIRNNAKPGTKLLYWNLLVPRRLSDSCPDDFLHKKQLSQKLAQKDKGFFYGSVIIDERK